MYLSIFTGVDVELQQAVFTDYRTVKNFKGSTETNILGEQIYIDSFECDIVTDDKIIAGNQVRVYDDVDTLLYRFSISKADRIDKHTVHIKAQSYLLSLEKKVMPAKMYTSHSFEYVLNDIFYGTYGSITYDENSSLVEKTISGFCPEQTARERLTWLAMVCGAYVGDGSRNDPEFALLDNIVTLIPIDKTFWHPTISYSDYVTGIRVTSYAFSEGQPSSGEEYVTDGTTTWVMTKSVYTATNSNVPPQTPDNIVSVDNCMLINSSNASDILSRLATYYFERRSVELDVINNFGQIKTGDKVYAYLSEDEIMIGYVERCDTIFGNQMRSSLRVGGVDTVTAGQVTVNYVSADELAGNFKIATRRYWFPAGYEVTINNPYLSITSNKNGYVTYWFRPETDTLTITANETSQTITVNCYVALMLTSSTAVLRVISVDGFNLVEESEDGTNYYVLEIE